MIFDSFSQTNRILTDLQLYYDFEELTRDKSGKNHKGKIHGTIDQKSGIVGKAGHFDGETTGIELGIQIDAVNTFMHDESSAKTFECLFKADSVKGKRVLFNEGGAAKGFTLRIENETLRLSTMVDGEFSIIEGEFSDTENWHHVVAVFDQLSR